MSEKMLNSLTVKELKTMLEELGERTTGNKNELVLRLLEFPEESQRLLSEMKNIPKADGGSLVADHMNNAENEADVEDGGSSVAEAKKQMSERASEKKMSAEEANEIEGCGAVGIIRSEIVKNQGENNEAMMSEKMTEMSASKQMSVFKEDELKIKEFELMKKELQIMEREMKIQKREIELLKVENEILRNKSSEAGTDKSVTKNFGVVKDLVSDFYGNGDNFELWSTQLKNIKRSYNLDDNNMRALISNKLKDKALKWLHSRPDLMVVSIENLLADMKSLFEDRSSRLTLKREFENRKWKSGESFEEYFYDKSILASKAMIDGSEMVEYLIEGIPDYTLRSYAQMQCFTDKKQLLEALHAIALPKRDRQSGASEGKAKEIRCYNCNSLGHMANECRKTKREIGACYVCAEKGHLAAACPKKKPYLIHAVLKEEEEDEYEH